MSSPPPPTHNIPIIDFTPFTTTTSSSSPSPSPTPAQELVAQQLDTAFRTTGFAYLTNFGIDEAVVDDMFAWSRRFFDLPMEDKMLAPHPPGGSHHRGYSAPGLEQVGGGEGGGGEPPDYKESFDSGNPSDPSQPNIFPPPTLLPGFQPALESYFTHCTLLIHRLLSALTLSLRLAAPNPQTEIPDLSPTHAQSLFQLRLLHYPPVAKHRSRITAHSDFGTLTLLFQDAVGGLEILHPGTTDEWRSAPPVPGTVLVNVGDLMARWSNERWRSTVHRVVGKGKEEEEVVMVPSRYSIPFFATADPETVIEALPGTWDDEAGNPKKFETVTAWGYVQMRMAALYE